ncbi:hypothetical protein AXA84_0266 [Candidatus Phytoplasma oryzae]|uniref:Uncharacterized protein n=1 Tax=Candidatus Phytoplasma oryzae TaxID=203274 RepID=A0A139JQI1_9MOLU|nr:hypothetical protein [Candidatus Phytoplasma oryzae]KXT29237.1 hypothetical protein AXA84_0266 [Candidatus Phytoplasma oryzae]
MINLNSNILAFHENNKKTPHLVSSKFIEEVKDKNNKLKDEIDYEYLNKKVARPSFEYEKGFFKILEKIILDKEDKEITLEWI